MLEYIWHCVGFALSLAMRSGHHTTQRRRRTRNRLSIKNEHGTETLPLLRDADDGAQPAPTIPCSASSAAGTHCGSTANSHTRNRYDEVFNIYRCIFRLVCVRPQRTTAAHGRPAVPGGPRISHGRRNQGSHGQRCELQFTHVGIAVIGDRADSVLEATSDGGVRMTALQEFLNKSARPDGRPLVVAKRLKDTAGVAAADPARADILGTALRLFVPAR